MGHGTDLLGNPDNETCVLKVPTNLYLEFHCQDTVQATVFTVATIWYVPFDKSGSD